MRRCKRHRIRGAVDLSGFWDFAFLGDAEPDAIAPADLTYDDVMPLPGCFDATPGYAGRRGLAAYHRAFCVDAPGRQRLCVDGGQNWCRLVVDGRIVGDHAGGFTRFWWDFDAAAGDHTLTLLVDNRFDDQRSPLHLDYFDWYQYGGVARSIELHRLGPLWIDSLRLDTLDHETRKVRLAVRCGCAEPDPGRKSGFKAMVDGRVLLEEELTDGRIGLGEPPGGGLIEREFVLKDASLWSPREPNLHTLSVTLGEDDWTERFGIRTVRAEDGRILVNGEPVRLFGVNRHESHPEFGCSLPAPLVAADVQLLERLGANFVRGSHYPQDPAFLDLCDERGICVWCEALGWQHTAEQLAEPSFLAAQLQDVDEMIGSLANHPSVILWGLLNESASHDPAARPGYQAIIERIRAHDPTRPVTFASNHPFDDLCFDLVDVISFNCYPGWYKASLAEIPQYIDGILEHIDQSGFRDKPVILSEIGAGAVPGFRDWNASYWSEEYQAQLLEEVLRCVGSRPRLSGLAIWQFSDCRSSGLADRALRRPRGFNNKGLLDEYRRPKPAFETVRDHFTRETARRR
jgi:beta-glucuronidase